MSAKTLWPKTSDVHKRCLVDFTKSIVDEVDACEGTHAAGCLPFQVRVDKICHEWTLVRQGTHTSSEKGLYEGVRMKDVMILHVF